MSLPTMLHWANKKGVKFINYQSLRTQSQLESRWIKLVQDDVDITVDNTIA